MLFFESSCWWNRNKIWGKKWSSCLTFSVRTLWHKVIQGRPTLKLLSMTPTLSLGWRRCEQSVEEGGCGNFPLMITSSSIWKLAHNHSPAISPLESQCMATRRMRAGRRPRWLAWGSPYSGEIKVTLSVGCPHEAIIAARTRHPSPLGAGTRPPCLSQDPWGHMQRRCPTHVCGWHKTTKKR